MRPTARYVGRSRLPYRVHVSDSPSTPADGSKVVGDWSRYIVEIIARPGWGAERLARESGIHKSTVYRWRNGEVTNVTIDSVRAITRAAGDEESVGLLAAGDALSNQAPGVPRPLTSLGLFLLAHMARLKLQRPDDLAESAGLPVDQVTAAMFDPEVDLDAVAVDGLAGALGVSAVNVRSAIAGDIRIGDGEQPKRDHLVDELDAMLSSDAPLSDAERRSLRALVDAAMEPYREKYVDVLHDRRAG
jgi:transcriptional regulator with XRE-family HTH domain